MAGKFISFEGLDFCGKSTQVRLLAQRLEKLNVTFQVVREPGGTKISEAIRQILLEPVNGEMHPRAEILLFEAARAQLVHEKLLPWLQGGGFLIADRFFDSTTAYQGYGRNLDIAFVRQLNQFATSHLVPARTFLLDIPAEESERRRRQAGQAGDRMESGDLELYRRIREGFLALAAQEPERFVILNGLLPIDQLHHQIWAEVSRLWGLPAR
ncbi:MAG: dTMP kinase [Calditrichaeota bacterium]|nr:MAG: dTMP kinase [Calditrichota bacterium]